MAFTVTPTLQGPMRVQLDWASIPGESYFYLYRCSGAGCVPSYYKVGTGNSVLTSGIGGTTYRYVVEVYDVFDALLDTSDIVEVTLATGLASNLRYYAAAVESIARLNGYDDASTTPANGLIIAPNGSAPLNNPFLRIKAVGDSSGSVGCDLTFYNWHWEVRYRPNQFAGLSAPINLAGVELPLGDACGYNPEFTEYRLYTEFRSNYYDLDTGESIGNTGTLKAWIDSNLMVDSAFDFPLTSGLVSVGWGTNKAIARVFVNGINVNPVSPLDPNLVMYQDFADPFVPAASITAGLIWYDPTFNNTSGGQIGVQTGGEIVSYFGGVYHAYTGVGIGVTLPPRTTAVTATGTLIVAKVTVPNNATDGFKIVTGGGLSPLEIELSNGESYEFSDLPAQSGYSILEEVPAGWTVGYVVSNGSPINNISIAEEEIVIVTITNTRDGGPGGSGSPNALSGVYKIVPGKRQDTLWNSLTERTTTDVKKPNPFAKTGYLGA